MSQKYEKREGLQSLKNNGLNIGGLYHRVFVNPTSGVKPLFGVGFIQRTTEKFCLTSVVLRTLLLLKLRQKSVY